MRSFLLQAVGNVLSKRIGDRTRARIARRGRLSDSELSLYVHGRRLPGAKKLAAVAKGLDCSPAALQYEIAHEMLELVEESVGEIADALSPLAAREPGADRRSPAAPSWLRPRTGAASALEVRALVELPVDELGDLIARRLAAELARRDKAPAAAPATAPGVAAPPRASARSATPSPAAPAGKSGKSGKSAKPGKSRKSGSKAPR